MQALPSKRIIEMIREQIPLEAICSDAGFSINIGAYEPLVGCAIHNGNRLREELQHNCQLNEQERWYEEDPHTADFVESLPIRLTALDSRYEYDLNRAPERAIYEEAWGREVWKMPLHSSERRESLRKHAIFYEVLHALVQVLEAKFGHCMVVDMHSYNYKRHDREVPVFNLGTERLNQEKFGACASHFCEQLSQIRVNGTMASARINNVFFGRGYLLESITQGFGNTLVLATEVKKIYCDELSGEVYPEIVAALSQQMGKAIRESYRYFANGHSSN